LPIGAATYAPCLLLVMLLVVQIFNSWFSFLSKVSDRFDPQKHPLTSPLVGVIVTVSIFVTLIGTITKILDTIF
jgi:hypothetical protein